MNRIAVIVCSEKGYNLALILKEELEGVQIYSTLEKEDIITVGSIADFTRDNFRIFNAFIFISSLGICVRSFAPCVDSKYNDPPVVCVDSNGKNAISVLSGHVGGANELTRRVANILGANPVITTQSDNNSLWSLDTLGKKYDWVTESNSGNLNEVIALFVNGKKTALLLEVKDKGTFDLEGSSPEHVDVFYSFDDICLSDYQLLITVTPFIYNVNIPVLYYRPKVLYVGLGCRKNCSAEGVESYIIKFMRSQGISEKSIKRFTTIDLKKDEVLTNELSKFNNAGLLVYKAEELKGIEVPNPSDKVYDVTSVYGVAEACAIKASGEGKLLIEKQKVFLTEGNDFTFAVALDKYSERSGFIEIVGAGPGDPELVSVKGKKFLEMADLILYAGSLVPIELTYYAKPGAVVRSSASMNLEEQFVLMKEFYDKGLFVVRLHTGDPCIYGAIQEQMAFFDEYGMNYHITPGISSFQAAAAALNSQFTIPEKVQTIILTRGEGRTPMPEKEKLHMLARSQSTMCIFLSASIAEEVQKELLTHYAPSTPVAVCYHLTWKDEKIFRGELKDLASIVKDNGLTLTTMIVVGEAIGNREGFSRLYADEFKHLFRK